MGEVPLYMLKGARDAVPRGPAVSRGFLFEKSRAFLQDKSDY